MLRSFYVGLQLSQTELGLALVLLVIGNRHLRPVNQRIFQEIETAETANAPPTIFAKHHQQQSESF
jgi:hypothetical protein